MFFWRVPGNNDTTVGEGIKVKTGASKVAKVHNSSLTYT